MLRTVLRGAAYSVAPRATFAVRHPREALELKKLPYDLRHAYAPRISALAAVAIAFPLGVLVGRLLERRGARRRAVERRRRRRQAVEAPRSVHHATSRRRDPAVADVAQPI